MFDISGSRGIERAFALDVLGAGPGLVLDIGPGPKPKASLEALRRGFHVVAVDREPARGEWMIYTLKQDRKYEWGWVKKELPEGDGFLLEIGPAPGDPKPARIAADRGWEVTAVGLEEPHRKLPEHRYTFIQGDFNEVKLPFLFDWILNISTIEHFGLAGRYGITEMDEDADLRGMAKARGLLAPRGRMLLTIPMGLDAMFAPKHRVYGAERLPLLLDGYHIIKQRFYGKFGGIDEYQECKYQQALEAVPTEEPAYYALGLYVLEAAG